MNENKWNEEDWRFKCSLPDGWRIREEGGQVCLDLYKERWGGWKCLAVLRDEGKDLDITESGDNIAYKDLLVIAEIVKYRMSK